MVAALHSHGSRTASDFLSRVRKSFLSTIRRAISESILSDKPDMLRTVVK